jgi:hypothetical protein
MDLYLGCSVFLLGVLLGLSNLRFSAEDRIEIPIVCILAALFLPAYLGMLSAGGLGQKMVEGIRSATDVEYESVTTRPVADHERWKLFTEVTNATDFLPIFGVAAAYAICSLGPISNRLKIMSKKISSQSNDSKRTAFDSFRFGCAVLFLLIWLQLFASSFRP